MHNIWDKLRKWENPSPHNQCWSAGVLDSRLCPTLIMGGGAGVKNLHLIFFQKFNFFIFFFKKFKYLKFDCQGPRVIIQTHNIDFGGMGVSSESKTIYFFNFMLVPIYYAHDCLSFGHFEGPKTAFITKI